MNLKRELAEEQEAANEGLAKRMKSHEKQYCFNETVKDKIQEAQTALNQSTPALEKAKSARIQKVRSSFTGGRSRVE